MEKVFKFGFGDGRVGNLQESTSLSFERRVRALTKQTDRTRLTHQANDILGDGQVSANPDVRSRPPAFCDVLLFR